MTENDRIKILRKALNLTQDEFGAKIGIKKSSISQIESGQIKPSDQTRLFICREFGVNEEWLRTGEGTMYSPAGEQARLEADLRKFLASDGDSFRERLVRLLMKLDASQWAALEEYARQLVGDPAPAEPDFRVEAEEIASQLNDEYRTGGGSSASPDTSQKDEKTG